MLNPHTDSLKFKNAILLELFEASYELMNPIQFKDYYNRLREELWEIVSGEKSTVLKVRNLLKPSGSGDSLNVQRYASYLQNVKAGDLKRCENTLKTLLNAKKELELLTGQVERKRAALFNPESQMVKLHCALELKKYDAILSSLKTCQKDLISFNNQISHTQDQLRAKIFHAIANKQEDRCKRRQDKETRRRKKNCAVLRRVDSANLVSQLLLKQNVVVKHPAKPPSLTHKFSVDALKGFYHILLKPKKHLHGMELLLELGAFPEESQDVVRIHHLGAFIEAEEN